MAEGIVTLFDTTKGTGVITPNDGGPAVLFSRRDIRADVTLESIVGRDAEFQVDNRTGTPIAKRIKIY